MNDHQLPLFDNNNEPNWEKEWTGMPEYTLSQSRPYAQIIFRFPTEEALQEFSALTGQRLTRRTKSAWHPCLGPAQRKRWTGQGKAPKHPVFIVSKGRWESR